MSTDLTLSLSSDEVVNVRANLVIIVGDSILFHSIERWEDKYITLFGGRVKFGETLASALKRELFEELSIVADLLYCKWYDHFFDDYDETSKHFKKKIHEFSGFGILYLNEEYIHKNYEIDGIQHKTTLISINSILENKVNNIYPNSIQESLKDYLGGIKKI